MTMTARILSAAMLLALLVPPTAAQDNPILARMAALAEAYNAGDAGAIAEFYTEDGALLPPRSAVLVGRERITAHYAQAFQNGVGALQYKVLEIRQLGPDAVVKIGETQVEAGGRTIVGRYMHVWIRQGETWRIHRDMYHVVAAQ